MNSNNNKQKGLKIRADNTYILSCDSTDNPKIGAKILSDGRSSLFLDFYLGSSKEVNERGEVVSKKKRKRQFLKLYLTPTPKTAEERRRNKETRELAKRIRYEREQELKAGTLGYRLAAHSYNFLDFAREYLEGYTKADKRIITAALRRFATFAKERDPFKRDTVAIARMTTGLMQGFADFLKETCRGTGAVSYWKRFKKVVKAATERGVLEKNPTDGIHVATGDDTLKKDILSPEEIAKLIATDFDGLDTEVRRAFIFTLYTGIRFCDIKELTFADIDASNMVLHFDQSKTEGRSKHSRVTTPLTSELLALATDGRTGDGGSRLFDLPSQSHCLKMLRKWTEAAGIKKHITWHCGRHSFAVNVLNGGANIKTVSSLLGHSSIQMTEKYTRAIDGLKRDAINRLQPVSGKERHRANATEQRQDTRRDLS